MPAEIIPTRGRAYMADLGHGEKPWLVVSNNGRNRQLDSCLAVRITTTPPKSDVPTIVPLGHEDGLVGYVRCDDVEQLDRDDLRRDVGAVTLQTMVKVEQALKLVFAIH